MKQSIYLDYNATAPLLDEVKEVMLEVMGAPYNASSVHSFGRKAKQLLESARQNIATALDAGGYQVIFTASGTEANNQALSCLNEPHELFISAVEHDSIMKIGNKLHARVLPVDENGIIDLNAMEKLLLSSQKKPFVSIMLANNETGVIQPIHEIAQIVFKHGGFLHCDIVQAVGKIPLSINNLNADMVTISGHKLGGPVGAAALIIKKGLQVKPFQVGGGQESGYRAGTENIAAIVGFAKAVEVAVKNMPAGRKRDYLESRIKEIAKDAVIAGEKAKRLPNTSNIAMPNMTAETQVIAFDLEGIAISSGSACSSGKVAESHVLSAMNVDQGLRNNAIRVSTGAQTTEEEIEAFIKTWERLYKKANDSHINKEAA